MLRITTACLAWLCLPLAVATAPVGAQEPGPEDEIIDAIRRLPQISSTDQERIARWIETQLEKYTSFAAFRKRFTDQSTNTGNSPQFVGQFAAQTAAVAAGQFAKSDLRSELAVSLAQVLLDMNRAEARPGFLACLKSSDARARYLCVKGLVVQQESIASDSAALGETVRALREAGLAESDPVVLGRIYEALALPGQVAGVFDAYMALFDKRLETRRKEAVIADGAEVYAYEFFRRAGMVGSLNAEQKSQLVAKLAVFLRMDAERYTEPSPRFNEIDRIERTLDGAEEILAALVGPAGGKIRDALSAGARENRGAVLQEAYRWVGNPETKAPGALNAAPWNVPVGAP